MTIMKNIIKLSCALVAALCIISCNEKIGSEILEPGDYITVSTDVAPHTKAGYEGTSKLPENFYIDIDQTGTEKDYKVTLTRVESSNKYIFPDNVQPKWASSDYSTVNIKAITTPSNYNRDNGSVSLSQDQSTEDAVLASDLLGAWTGNGIEISSGNVVVHFNHLMSKLYVKYNTSNVEVSSISLNNICTNGFYNFASQGEYTSGSTDDITMYHNSSDDTAEAIFFPYTPTTDNVNGKEPTGMPELSVTVNGTPLPALPISLEKVGGTFQPGKRYIMNVTITGSTIEGAEVTVSEWTPDITTITTPGENVLWVGTSIPAGNASLNYPAEVDRAMTCHVINNAIGSAHVSSIMGSDPSWVLNTTFEGWENKWVPGPEGETFSIEHIKAGNLSSKREEANMYKNNLRTVYDNYKLPAEPVAPVAPVYPNSEDYTTTNWWGRPQFNETAFNAAVEAYNEEYAAWKTNYAAWEINHAAWEKLKTAWDLGRDGWAQSHIAKIQQLSYESLIIDYIDGTKANCTTVIIDHGFNDLSNMIYIAGVFSTQGEHVRGYEYLRKMRDKEKSVADFEQEILNNPNTDEESLNFSYIHAMAKVIDAIKAKKPEVRIIIGNYFSLYSPYVARTYQVQHEREYLYTLAENANGASYKLVPRQERVNGQLQNVKNPAYTQFPDYATFSNLICYYNEAIAGIYDLDIVNVYEHITIPESMFWGGTQGYTYDGKAVYDTDGSTPVDFDPDFNPIVRTDYTKFCPDGVHPSNPAAVGAIAEIYIDHLDGIVGSRGQDHPSSSSSSVNTSSILGIDSWDEEIF